MVFLTISAAVLLIFASPGSCENQTLSSVQNQTSGSGSGEWNYTGYTTGHGGMDSGHGGMDSNAGYTTGHEGMDSGHGGMDYTTGHGGMDSGHGGMVSGSSYTTGHGEIPIEVPGGSGSGSEG